MSDNGDGKKPQVIVQVLLEDGKMNIVFGKVNLAMISHALRLASLNLDNAIIGNEQKKKQQVVEVPKAVIDKMRQGF